MTISTLPPPTIRPIEDVRLIEKPDPYIVTAREYKYYLKICEDYGAAGREAGAVQKIHDTAEEILAATGLTEQDSCGFAVYGLPTQKWLNMEADINTMVSYIERLRVQLDAAYRQLVDRYEIANKTAGQIKRQLSDAP